VAGRFEGRAGEREGGGETALSREKASRPTVVEARRRRFLHPPRCRGRGASLSPPLPGTASSARRAPRAEHPINATECQVLQGCARNSLEFADRLGSRHIFRVRIRHLPDETKTAGGQFVELPEGAPYERNSKSGPTSGKNLLRRRFEAGNKARIRGSAGRRGLRGTARQPKRGGRTKGKSHHGCIGADDQTIQPTARPRRRVWAGLEGRRQDDGPGGA